MDLDYRILNLYRSRRFDQCILLCSEESAVESRLRHFIKMRAMTIQAKIAGSAYDEIDYLVTEEGALSDTGLAKTPRPGTTFQRDIEKTSHIAGGTTQTAATAGRARTGGGGGGGTVRTSRTARTALATAARAARAASALHTTGGVTGGPVALGVLTSEHLMAPTVAKILFEYVFFSEGDVRKAMEIVLQAQKGNENADWWWNFASAKCYITLGLKRNAEYCLRLSLKQSKHVSIYLRLISMYVGLNQPLSALQMCENGLALFPNDTALHLEEARIHEAMGNPALAIKAYRTVAIHDANNMEAIANIAHYNFYNDQPEIALRYYRRLLATTDPNPELFNNLGLCCLSCNQLDLVVSCFKHALFLATNPEIRAELWFNLAHVALVAGDLSLAQRCLQASLSIQSDFQPALDTFTRLRTFLKMRTLPNYNTK